MSAENVLYDRDALLERIGGDEDLIQVILQVFLEETPEIINALKLALDQDDIAGAKIQAHTLKGSCANVSAENLRALAYDIEKACREEDLAQAKTVFEQVPEAISALQSVMTVA